MQKSTATPAAQSAGISHEWISLNATVFVSSAAIMMIELVAGRIIGRHLGASVYTWTSVIGIVLAGIAVGNYIGGMIADRHSSHRTLALLFVCGSIMSGLIAVFDHFAEGFSSLWTLSWPMRVASHVAIVFFIPTAFLGTISPVIAKMALDLGRERGRTIGDIYACGVVGSIVGTFIAGYFLIGLIGTLGVVWAVAVVLALMAAFYDRRNPAIWVWTPATLLLTVCATSDAAWARSAGEALLIRLPRSDNVIYQTESNYSYIEIVQFSKDPDIRGMHLDTLLHSQKQMDRIDDFRYAYEKVYLAITRRLRPNAQRIDSLTIGGGGYVYPQFMNQTWPSSRTDVVEIDPAVTEAAMAAFGLPRDTTINYFHEDGRVFVDRLSGRMAGGATSPPYDFIYCDAVNDYSVPHQLTTREFMTNARSLLKPDGAYLMNMIDLYNSGLLLGAIISTMQDVFPHVNVFIEQQPLTFEDGRPNDQIRATRMTFIVAGTNQPFDVNNLGPLYRADCAIFPLSQAEKEAVRERSGYIVLTDGYAPVENLLAPVVRDSALAKAVEEWNQLAKTEVLAKRYARGVEILQSAIGKFPDPVYQLPLAETLGNTYELMGRYADAATQFEKVLKLNALNQRAHAGLVTCYTELKQPEKAAEIFADLVEIVPNDASLRFSFGGLLLSIGRYNESIAQFAEAVAIDPHNCAAYNNMGVALTRMNNPRSAVKAFRLALRCDPASSDARRNLDSLIKTDSIQREAELAAALQAAERQPDSPDAAEAVADAYYALHYFDEALATFDRVVAARPDDVEAQFKRANCLLELQRLDEAKAGYRRVLEIQPGHPEAAAYIQRIEEFQSRSQANPTPASHPE